MKKIRQKGMKHTGRTQYTRRDINTYPYYRCHADTFLTGDNMQICRLTITCDKRGETDRKTLVIWLSNDYRVVAPGRNDLSGLLRIMRDAEAKRLKKQLQMRSDGLL